jgi:hypothetical protein
MRVATVSMDGQQGLALIEAEGRMRAGFVGDESYPGDLQSLLDHAIDLIEIGSKLREAPEIDATAAVLLPPIPTQQSSYHRFPARCRTIRLRPYPRSATCICSSLPSAVAWLGKRRPAITGGRRWR